MWPLLPITSLTSHSACVQKQTTNDCTVSKESLIVAVRGNVSKTIGFYMSGNVLSFLSGTKHGKNGPGAMTSVRQNPRGRIKRENFFFFLPVQIYYLKFFS